MSEAFRAAMRNVAAAVAVVTTTVDGVPFGTTVSAVLSLSMDPPMVLVSLDRTSTLLSRLRVGTVAGLNILAAHQAPLAERFATKLVDKFDGVAWLPQDGAPALAERHAWVATRVCRLVEAGDHVLVLADVLRAQAGEEAAGPLTYWRRGYGTHQPASEGIRSSTDTLVRSSRTSQGEP